MAHMHKLLQKMMLRYKKSIITLATRHLRLNQRTSLHQNKTAVLLKVCRCES